MPNARIVNQKPAFTSKYPSARRSLVHALRELGRQKIDVLQRTVLVTAPRDDQGALTKYK